MTYIVMVRSAPVSGRRRQYGPYKYCAVVELDPEWEAANPDGEPAMISTRARGVKRIVRESAALYAGGKTERGEWFRILAEFKEMTKTLNYEPAEGA